MELLFYIVTGYVQCMCMSTTCGGATIQKRQNSFKFVYFLTNVRCSWIVFSVCYFYSSNAIFQTNYFLHIILFKLAVIYPGHTYGKLHCKRQPYQFSNQRDSLAQYRQTHRHISCYFYIRIILFLDMGDQMFPAASSQFVLNNRFQHYFTVS